MFPRGIWPLRVPDHHDHYLRNDTLPTKVQVLLGGEVLILIIFLKIKIVFPTSFFSSFENFAVIPDLHLLNLPSWERRSKASTSTGLRL